ncbi:MAG: hypothetical protein AUH78_22535 [Gemmatimonadetes bacterium 13_1_40CM_4_69_8]|nr:MAG: hypothetical protein AUH78_22535 [Gemmatimonadetes bacterium 13_1_40CM_4_69_8]
MFGGLTVAALVAVGSCSDDVGPTTNERFVATLSGANEVPAVTTTATGTAEFTVFNGLPGIFFKVDVKGPFADSVILAHIHGPADPTGNAAVIVNLFLGPNAGPAITGTLAEGVLPTPSRITFDSVLVLLRAGKAYVNVHTKTNGGGEIRGQIAKQ